MDREVLDPQSKGLFLPVILEPAACNLLLPAVGLDLYPAGSCAIFHTLTKALC